MGPREGGAILFVQTIGEPARTGPRLSRRVSCRYRTSDGPVMTLARAMLQQLEGRTNGRRTLSWAQTWRRLDQHHPVRRSAVPFRMTEDVRQLGDSSSPTTSLEAATRISSRRRSGISIDDGRLVVVWSNDFPKPRDANVSANRSRQAIAGTRHSS